MPTALIDKIRAALKRPAPTIQQLADALADARQADADARAAVETAATVVSAGFLDSADKRARDRASLATAREVAEDVALVLAEAERRHAATLAADEDGRRQAVYADAKAKADAAALSLSRTYPKLASGMIAMLKDLAEAQQAVAIANAALPDGAEPIADPEMSARGVPGLPGEVVSDEEVELWGRFDLDVPVDPQFQDQIYDCGNGWGKRGSYEMGTASMGEPQAAYRRRLFRKVVTRQPTPGDWPIRLAAGLMLPAVRGSAMLWGDAYAVHNPGLAAAVLGQAEPHAVLSRIADLEAAAVANPVKAERALHVDYPSHRDVVPLPDAQPNPDRHREVPRNTGSRFGASPFQPAGARAVGRR